jgi:release factor glutamine methyltransferase
LEKLNKLQAQRGALTIIDVCTGSGNLALSYAYYIAGSTVFCSDISSDAIELARRNGQLLSLDNVHYFVGDLFTPFRLEKIIKNCDLVSCNPPYISTSKITKMHREISHYEPELAFDGGLFGISILSKVIKEGPDFLKPDSWLCFEVGKGQGSAIATKLGKSQVFKDIDTFSDNSGNIRAICAQTAG